MSVRGLEECPTTNRRAVASGCVGYLISGDLEPNMNSGLVMGISDFTGSHTPSALWNLGASRAQRGWPAELCEGLDLLVSQARDRKTLWRAPAKQLGFGELPLENSACVQRAECPATAPHRARSCRNRWSPEKRCPEEQPLGDSQTSGSSPAVQWGPLGGSAVHAVSEALRGPASSSARSNSRV